MSALLSTRRLVKEFSLRSDGERGERRIRAVDGVGLDVEPGEVFGLVGESGSGKTTLARMLVRLLAPTSGEIRFRGHDLLALRGSRLRRERRAIQMTFQDPYEALDPRMKIADSLFEPLLVHRLATRREKRERIAELLAEVGLPASAAELYPHQFSGGQRQRIGIARALATDPELLIADEPVSALDPSVRSQIVNLLAERQRSRSLTMILIAHDLAYIEQSTDRLAVLFRGRIVESGPTRAVLGAPAHPYTAELRASTPGRGRPSAPQVGRQEPERESASIADSGGCPYSMRCPAARIRCREESPLLHLIAPGIQAACHYPGEWHGKV